MASDVAKQVSRLRRLLVVPQVLRKKTVRLRAFTFRTFAHLPCAAARPPRREGSQPLERRTLSQPAREVSGMTEDCEYRRAKDRRDVHCYADEPLPGFMPATTQRRTSSFSARIESGSIIPTPPVSGGFAIAYFEDSVLGSTRSPCPWDVFATVLGKTTSRRRPLVGEVILLIPACVSLVTGLRFDQLPSPSVAFPTRKRIFAAYRWNSSAVACLAVFREPVR